MFNGAVWFQREAFMRAHYLGLLYLPQLLSLPVGGVSRVSRMTLHWDSRDNEFYLCTTRRVPAAGGRRPACRRGQ